MVKTTEIKMFENLRSIGENSWELKLSPQAKLILKSFDENDFPWEHFKQWWVKHYGGVSYSHLSHYLSAKDGFTEAKE